MRVRVGVRFSILALACLALAAAGGLLLAPPALFPVRAVCALLLIALPGYLVVAILPLSRPLGPLEQVLLSGGFSYAVAVLAGLTVFYVGGRLTPQSVLAAYVLVILALVALSWRPGGDIPALRPDWRRLSPVIVLLIFGAYFRLWGLGYSDFLVDETLVLRQVVAAVGGEPGALFQHFKGPGETFWAGLFCILVGRLDELTARLPFVLVGILDVAAFYLAGRELFGERVGLAAGALAALNGFFVGFSRLVQYQSLVLLMATLCIWAVYRWYGDGDRAWLVVAAAIGAMGLLAHYEIAFLLPGILYLLWKKRAAIRAERRAYLRTFLAATLAGVLLLAYFAVPYLLSPGAAQTARHVSSVVGGESLYNHLNWLLQITQFFNTTYYAILIVALFVFALPGPLRGVGRRQAVYALCAAGAVVALLALFSGFAELNWALAVSLAVFLLLATSAGASVAYKVTLTWFAVPFFVYVFFVRMPRTHFYVLFIAGTLLAAVGLVNAYEFIRQWPRQKGLRRAVAASGLAGLLALYLLSAYGIHLLFARYDLEYLFNYPRDANPLYWVDADYRDRYLALNYGIPLRAGWQMVSELYRTGTLQGDWQSNDRGKRIDWYTLSRPQNGDCYPRYYFITEFDLRSRTVSDTILEQDYALWARVWSGGQLKMSIYTLGPESVAADAVLDFQEPLRYDTYTTWDSFNYSTTYPANANVNLAGRARLVGYEVDNWQARPGGKIAITLYWQAIERMDRRYKVFVHVEDSRMWGQQDAEPRCGTRPTAEWEPGRVVMDRHLVALAPDTPPGEHPLNVGLYDEASGQRLEVLDEQGAAQGNFISLGKVVVR
jgi:4-amino-4-deoxy-L-arabinose transferase-like glycosyltransferase